MYSSTEEKNYLERFLDGDDRVMLEKEARFKQIMMMYSSGIREVTTKLEVLNDDLKSRYQRNPIHSIKSRIKTPVSIAKKLKKRGLPVCVDSIRGNLNDVAGVRVICSFIDDIYTIAEMLTSQTDITLIKMKDYIENPKPNGYRSLHLIIEVPVFFADKMRPMRVEVQIRTIAMDYWASLDHQLRYKKDDLDEQTLTDMEQKLKHCADVISETDMEMLDIRKNIYGFRI
ncbi:MAG: GTP pyrophosphokinase family protein [Eubacteriales bacterium]|nr:GTP pyrophosphokinase family protein [Eubacteriales bacterium]